MEDAIKGECVVVVDCPSEAYLPALKAALPAIVGAMEDPAHQRLSLVFHLAPRAVQQAATYQEVLQGLAHCVNFGPEGRFDPAQHAPALASAVNLQVSASLMAVRTVHTAWLGFCRTLFTGFCDGHVPNARRDMKSHTV